MEPCQFERDSRFSSLFHFSRWQHNCLHSLDDFILITYILETELKSQLSRTFSLLKLRWHWGKKSIVWEQCSISLSSVNHLIIRRLFFVIFSSISTNHIQHCHVRNLEKIFAFRFLVENIQVKKRFNRIWSVRLNHHVYIQWDREICYSIENKQNSHGTIYIFHDAESIETTLLIAFLSLSFFPSIVDSLAYCHWIFFKFYSSWREKSHVKKYSKRKDKLQSLTRRSKMF